MSMAMKYAIYALLMLLFIAGCASVRPPTAELPPILAPDEIIRPYVKVGTLRVTRTVLGAAEIPKGWSGGAKDIHDADFAWGSHALREEAAKIGADAVILPEIKAEMNRLYLFFIPSTEFTAKGVAIKFR